MRARHVVERETRRTFIFSDLSGDVDFRSTDGEAALEVTRFTNPILRRDQAVATNRDHVLELGTAYDWHVTFEGHPKYNELPTRLYPALHALETHRLASWDPSSMYWWAQGVPTLRAAIEQMSTEGVLHARSVASTARPSRLFVYPSGSYSYGGPDAALRVLEDEIALEADHVAKLASAGTSETHLWIWTDFATIGDFRRALDDEETALPSRRAHLEPEVTHLWIMDEPARRGWQWSRESGWLWVSE